MSDKFTIPSDLHRSIPATEFCLLFESDKSSILLDVRTAEEFATGHLIGAVNIDITQQDFYTIMDNLNPEQTIFVYCQNGKRSLLAAKYLASVGCRVISLQNGMNTLVVHEAE